MIICAVVVTILLSTMLSKKQGVQVTEKEYTALILKISAKAKPVMTCRLDTYDYI